MPNATNEGKKSVVKCTSVPRHGHEQANYYVEFTIFPHTW